jgi:hypothetical protein
MIDANKFPNINCALRWLKVELPENYNLLSPRYNLDFIEMDMKRIRTQMMEDSANDLYIYFVMGGDESLTEKYNAQIVSNFLDWMLISHYNSCFPVNV